MVGPDPQYPMRPRTIPSDGEGHVGIFRIKNARAYSLRPSVNPSTRGNCVPNRRSLLRVALLTAVGAAGCSTLPTEQGQIMLRAADGAIWLRPDDIHRYLCEDGLLVCTDGNGRLSSRLCRCEG